MKRYSTDRATFGGEDYEDNDGEIVYWDDVKPILEAADRLAAHVKDYDNNDLVHWPCVTEAAAAYEKARKG